MDNDYKIIETKILKGRIPDFHEKRKVRISEAILFKLGTKNKPKKTHITTLFDSKEVCFYKPGKEYFRKANPNIHDMFPGIWNNGINEVDGWTFENLWEYLIKISIINQITFKKVLVILYRNCFLLDHLEIKPGKYRYHPSKSILDYIEKIEFGLKDGFLDKFNTKEIGLLEFLHFVDLLGWNEDVKYHTINGKPYFDSKNKKTGRINTIMNIIMKSIMVNEFILKININKFNLNLILSTLRKLINNNLIYKPTNREFINYLNPFLIK
ncbi:MAG: hypothetical protein EPN82_11550 [Bacteroidetes bacterium]|nr:MAG: hypothetical protein EPN82_11550 [Bacteroidota bacterium]